MTVDGGELFAGRYRIDERLGESGMGVVYRALDERLGRRVAIKVMKPSVAGDPDFRARFATEASTAATLDGPHVVAIYDYAEYDGRLYLVMGHVPGRDLRQVLETTGALGLARTVAVVEQVAAALEAAHSQGHLHRDVKPANLLLGTDADGRERALVTDFGLAQPQVRTTGTSGTGQVLGTAAYVSPEQVAGEPATTHSDVYALACVTFECLTGAPAFPGATDVKHHEESRDALRSRLSGQPPAVAAVVVRSLAVEPERRAGSALAFAQDLR